jgi:hypothetical protein
MLARKPYLSSSAKIAEAKEAAERQLISTLRTHRVLEVLSRNRLWNCFPRNERGEEFSIILPLLFRFRLNRTGD